MQLRFQHIFTLVLISLFLFGCKMADSFKANSANNGPNIATNTKAEAVEPNEDGTIPSGTGAERSKPAAGKGNVQGKAFFNEKPAIGVDVKLCKTFNRFIGGCSGETFTAKTDDAGEYVLENVTPGVYEGLTVRVFNTPYFVFATSGIVSAAKYNIEAGKTYFAPDTNLFKNDLKLIAPKAGSKVAPENIEVSWTAYPDAEYYKLSINGDSTTGAKTVYDYIDKRVDDTKFSLDQPLDAGTYMLKVDAYNTNDIKLAQSSSDIKFTVK